MYNFHIEAPQRHHYPPALKLDPATQQNNTQPHVPACFALLCFDCSCLCVVVWFVSHTHPNTRPNQTRSLSFPRKHAQTQPPFFVFFWFLWGWLGDRRCIEHAQVSERQIQTRRGIQQRLCVLFCVAPFDPLFFFLLKLKVCVCVCVCVCWMLAVSVCLGSVYQRAPV